MDDTIMSINNQNNIPNNIYLYYFSQLKAYHNFKNRFVNMYEKGQNNSNFIINEFYLIDRKWIKKWKKYIGYNQISRILKKSRELVDNDYYWVEPIMKKNMEENELPPLFNQNIYQGNQINPLADFIIIDKVCYKSFIQEKIYEISYPLKFFKETTMNKSIVMGFNTFESLPKLLDGRNHIVLTHRKLENPDIKVVSSVDELLKHVENIEDDVFVIGGATIYRLLMPYSNKMLITEIDEIHEADAYFPLIDNCNCDKELLKANEDNGIKYKHYVYKRNDK